MKMAIKICCVVLVIFSCFVNGTINVSHSTSTKDVQIIKNTGIKVNYGRATMLTPDNLQVRYSKNSMCKISVLKTNPFTSRIGAFLPSEFPCDFEVKSVYYQHYGSMSISNENIKLQIRVDTEDDTILKPITFNVKIGLYKPFEILQRIEILVVDEIGGLSEPFSNNIIGFRYDPIMQKCMVRFLPSIEGPPYYGSLVNASDPNGFGKILNFKDISCSELLKGNVRYVHQRSRRTSNRDYLPFVVELFDKSTSIMEKREFIQVPVRIRRAPENQPPIVNYNEASYSLQVDQLVLTALTPDVLRVEDRETESGSIVFNITQKYLKDDGYLVHTDDPSVPVRTFYQKDIDELKIAYKASDQLITTQRMQQIWMEARDTYGAASSPFYIIIVIKPMNSFAPRVIKNEILTMFEGQSRLISRDVLSIRDPDNENDVIIKVSNGLKNGRLEMFGKSITKLTVADIAANRVRYIHDGSDSNSDNIVFHISDGKHSIQVLFVVLIVPRDDQPPQLTYNTGLRLDEGDNKIIGQFQLMADDVDSDNTKIKYTIIKGPVAGKIVFRQTQIPDDFGLPKQDWVFSNNHYQRSVEEFTQVDIILGRIFYQHSGAEIFHDTFTFRLSDNADPQNQSGIKTFIIVINPIDDMIPEPYPGCPFSLSTANNQPGVFTKQNFRYIDADSPDEQIRYKIISQPYFKESGLSAGKVYVSRSGRSEIADQFTQKYVNHFKVKYMASSNLFYLNNSTKVVFNYDVSDIAGNSRKNQTFSIDLRFINNKPPSFETSVLSVSYNGKGVIEVSNLYAQDADSDPEDLRFIIKKLPLFGALVNNGILLSTGSAISLKDIRQKHVIYLHAGSDVKDDVVKFVLTDKVNMIPVQLRLNIIKDGFVKESRLRHLESSLNVLENGLASIDKKTLGISSDDFKNAIFKIERKPKHGRIENQGVTTDTFSLRDIEFGQVVYRHTDGEVGLDTLQDHFNFTLADESEDIFIGGDLYAGVALSVDIDPVNTQPPVLKPPLMVEVAEANKAIMILDISDADTRPKNVICNITTQPLFGFIENITPLEGSEIEHPNIPVQNFSISDMMEGRVKYVQSKHKAIEPDMDFFYIQCYDGNNTSPVTKIHVSITPTNDEAPILFVQNQIICIEDDLVIFDLSKVNPYDRDLPADRLTFTVTKQPKNGELLLQKITEMKPAVEFGVEALSGSTQVTLIYQHKGTETTSDVFELTVSDGVHSVNQSVYISVIPMDDERPRLVINTGLKVDRGESKTITSRNLKAEDLDSEDSSLLFIIMMESIAGKLQKLNSSNLYTDLKKGGNFTQDDIDKKRIRYTQLNVKSEERDLIRLDITDGFNRLINQIFNVIITPEDNIIPVVVNKGLRLPENSRATLSTDVLSASDINTPDEKLQFIVTRLPLKGFLEHADHHGVPLTRFDQLDLAANKISYIHTSLDEIKADNFEFEVTDGQNKVFRTFRIHIESVDNKLPVLRKSLIYTGQGQEKIITPFELNAKDNDTAADKVIFQIYRPPKHGTIYLDGITRTYRFTQKDITDNRLSYQHDASLAMSDRFSVAISDGTNIGFFMDSVKRESAVDVKIKISAIDKNAPVLVTNKPITSLRVRPKKTFARLLITHLQAVDSHAKGDHIIFNITTPPKEGKLIHRKNKSMTITRFTQGDVNSRQIEYILHENKRSVNDIFFFDVLDNNGNKLKDQNFKLNWARVCVLQKEITVKETGRKVTIKFKRFGNLHNSAFATIDVTKNFETDNLAFIETEKVVHWRSGAEITSTSLELVDDAVFDKVRIVTVKLRDGINTLVGKGCNMTIEVTDPEDEPVVEILGDKFVIDESIGMFRVPLLRKGDAKDRTSVYCITQSGTARGTSGYAVTSYHDYISRFYEEAPSIVEFLEGERSKMCEIRVIDDTTFEIDETFKVHLRPAFGGKINKEKSTASVTIKNDPKDELEFSLENSTYIVSEDVGFIKLIVKRTGLDRSFKSYVQIMTKELLPVSAKANVDYKSIFKTLEFGVGVTSLHVELQIYDDQYRPRMEGEESFTVELRNPQNGRLSTTHAKAKVTIQDSENDSPKVGFENAKYEVDENKGKFIVPLIRDGDVSQEVFVICYTRQGSAKVVQDFKERPRNRFSVVKFKKSERTKNCEVEIIDDKMYEEDESFRLELEPYRGNVRISDVNRTVITIKDNDQPRVYFSERKYYFYEPSAQEKSSVVYVTIIRDGDIFQSTSVDFETSDGSAKSGLHYEPLAKTLSFSPNISKLSVPLKIHYVKNVNIRLSFSLLLIQNFDDEVADVRQKKAVVSIEERLVRSDVTFPLNPIVVSLLDYDDVIKANKKQATNGYPLVCVTACDTEFPYYLKSSGICNQERIVNNRTVYRWQIQNSDVIGSYRDILSPVFFTRTDSITLDSIYFTQKSRVRCIARAYSFDGGLGLESRSDVIEISQKDGVCQSRDKHRLAESSFSAQVSYTGPDHPKYKNKVKLRILIPHYDGLLPVISTKKLSNFELILSSDVSRAKQHVCSNLLKKDESPTKVGFVTSKDTIYTSQSFERNNLLRSENTVRFYENLNLESCLWTFESYYDVNELVTLCGGNIVSDGFIRNSVQSNLVLMIPLFVSYLYPSNKERFVEYNHKTSIRLTAVYDTGALWSEGVGLASGKLEGELYPSTIIVLSKDNRLLFKFKTKAAFRGVFIPQTRDGSRKSTVTSADHPLLSFTLRHMNSDKTFDQPQQDWEMTSDMAVRDYSGTYKFNMIPCLADQGVEFSWPPSCTPQAEVTFDLPLSIHQTSKPIESAFTLNTEFHVAKNEDNTVPSDLTDNVAFDEGDNIYGRVLVATDRNAYRVKIEKVLLCTGQDGYIPIFNPDDNEFGCLVDTDKLMYRLQILNRINPQHEDRVFAQVPFQASFLKRKGGADRFKLSSTPLFKAPNVRSWYLHVVYKVRSKKSQNKHTRDRRNVENEFDEDVFHHQVFGGVNMETTLRRKRDLIISAKYLKDLKAIGRKKGTNLKMLNLRRKKSDYVIEKEFPTGKSSPNSANKNPVLIYGITGGFVVLILILGGVVVYRKYYHTPPAPAVAQL